MPRLYWLSTSFGILYEYSYTIIYYVLYTDEKSMKLKNLAVRFEYNNIVYYYKYPL